MKRWGTLLGLVLCMAVPAQADEALQKVFDCMQANLPPTLRVQRIELENTDRNGSSRTLSGKLYAMREKSGGAELLRATLRIDAPDYLAGASYLVRESKPGTEDEMYVFLPSVNRVRRVVGDAGYDSLLGTNFSYVDFKQVESGFGAAPATLEAPQQIENAFDDSDGTLEKPGVIEQHPVYVIAFKPKADQSSRYSLLRAWVDQKTCVALKVDFFEGDVPRKEFSAPVSSIQQSGNYWYLSQALMQDLKDHTSTQLRVVGVSSGTELATRYFDPHSFYLGN